MNEELNIAAILKDKPKGIKLWTDAFGEVELYVVSIDCFQVKHHDREPWFNSKGRLYDDGNLCIFPSRNMRDWSKFAWKKGDVLTDNISTICIFDGWANDDYTEFKAKYTLHLISSNNAESEVCKTNNFVSVIKDEDKQSYLATAEKFFNVNLTKGSLEIEKPEFKDGDIVHKPAGDITDEAIFIAKVETKGVLHSYIYMSKDDMIPFENCSFSISGCLDSLRPATDSEKQQLFDALAKEGKRWNPDTLQIEDLPTKCEFKAFDKVLVRDDESCVWNAAFFSHKYGKYFCSTDFHVWQQCIPYNDQTAHLLGTTDEWKGNKA